MFLRVHRIGGAVYHEVLVSYRDRETGRPKHRCVARWQSGVGLDDLGSALRHAKREQQAARRDVDAAAERVAEARRYLGHAERDGATDISHELALLVRADGVLRRRQRLAAKAERFLARLLEAEAGLGGSGKRGSQAKRHGTEPPAT
jgi:hypothetical protein